MISIKTLVGSIAPLLTVFATGCAPAYHSYRGCNVDCKYCPPQPLPYTHYQDCVCHSCAALPYLTVPPRTFVQDTNGIEDSTARD